MATPTPAHRPKPACLVLTLLYSHAMASTTPASFTGIPRIFAWPRWRFTLAVSAAFGFLLSLGNETSTLVVMLRAMIVGSAILLVFGLFERWPKRLPNWLPRTVLRLLAIVVIIPFAAAIAYA